MTRPKSAITTHVLDLGTGKPAHGVAVQLFRVTGPHQFDSVAQSETNADGRIMHWFSDTLTPGVYRLTFATGAWYEHQGKSAFYPEISIDVQFTDLDVHYHVPLLLNQWGYSTYRGS